LKRYIALLRAINVGGHSGVKMHALQKLFEDLGLVEVQTYIQTGNVVFATEEADRQKLIGAIEHRLEQNLGYATKVLLLTPDELQDAAAKNPFEPRKHDEKQHCHLYFLERSPEPENIERLMAMAAPEYCFQVQGAVLYYAYDRQYAGKRRQINFEKILGVAGTSRTWKVVDKLIELADTKIRE
jgi:uncharacterized protein (DUF1697 family)